MFKPLESEPAPIEVHASVSSDLSGDSIWVLNLQDAQCQLLLQTYGPPWKLVSLHA